MNVQFPYESLQDTQGSGPGQARHAFERDGAVGELRLELCERVERAIRQRGLVFSAYDLHTYVNDASQDFGLHSQTVQRVATEYATRRKQFEKRRLAWHKSFGARRSLSWIPINTGAAKWKHGQLYHNGQYFKAWKSYGLDPYPFRPASFNEDARGRWYVNGVVDLPAPAANEAAAGVDLGLKDIATCSDGQKLVDGRFYRDLEGKLATVHRALARQSVFGPFTPGSKIGARMRRTRSAPAGAN